MRGITNEQNLKFYSVTVKGAHTDMGKLKTKCFIPLELPIAAVNGREAAHIGRWTPRVRHHDPCAVLNVTEINRTQYEEIKNRNSRFLYFSVNSIQQQRKLIGDLSSLIVFDEEKPRRKEEKEAVITDKKEREAKPMYHKKQKIRNKKAFLKLYHENYTYDDYDYADNFETA